MTLDELRRLAQQARHNLDRVHYALGAIERELLVRTCNDAIAAGEERSGAPFTKVVPSVPAVRGEPMARGWDVA